MRRFDIKQVCGLVWASDWLANLTRLSAVIFFATGCVARIEVPRPDSPHFVQRGAAIGTADSFTVQGKASADARVRLYDNAQCDGEPIATITGAEFIEGISITATRSRMYIYATAQVGKSRVSPCSATGHTYVRVVWVWADGADRPTYSYDYGTKGVAAASNYFRPRGQPSTFQTADGVRWYFGGNGPFYGDLNDLWSYDPKSHLWTWVSGSNTTGSTGTYGTLGVAAPTNVPPSRAGNAGWMGDDGNFYLYGGFTSAPGVGGGLGDMWKYDPRAGEWTWISGVNTRNSSSLMGTIKVPSTSNRPGNRMNQFEWKDRNGRLWMFGGQAHGNAPYGGMWNDLWRFDPETLEWAWMSGSNLVNASGTYPTLKTSSSTAAPGARMLGCAATSADGTFWLFGGQGRDEAGTSGRLNDLWTYNPETELWTWRAGAKTVDRLTVYGEQGVASEQSMPGGRRTSACWFDSDGRLWLFGGEGFAESGPLGRLSDLWFFDPKTDQWTWWSGSKQTNTLGEYGVKGVPSATNRPGARQDLSRPIVDENGRMWMVGGSGLGASGAAGPLGDVWYIQTP